MNDTKEDVAWFGIRFLDVFFDRFRKRFVTSLVALNNFRTGLVDNNHMIIFVNDCHV